MSVFDLRWIQFSLFLVAVTSYLFKRLRYATASRGLPLPPGPSGKPIIGSLLELAQHETARALARYREPYGDIVMFQGLGNKVLMLNSLQAINDLLDKRSSKYSHRPESVFGGELVGMHESMVFLSYGDEWRAHRRLAHAALNPTQVKQYHTIQEDIATSLAKSLLDTPEDFFSLVRMSAGRTVIAVTYGIPASSAQTEYILTGESFLEIAGKATIPGNYLCDFISPLKYAPSWVPFQQEAAEGRKLMKELLTKPFEHVKRDMDAGVALPSLTRNLLMSPPDDTSDFDRRLMWVAGSMFAAGAETTYATVLSFILAMALNPDKLKLAQAEIDAVIGNDRLPTIQDRGSLPYVEAVIKETMRWQPALPLSVARRSAEDDFYRGYYIPKDTVVIPNVWALAYEPNSKYNPEAFLPERFLDPTQSIVDPGAWAFGFGRRICPGRHMGENSVFILIATLLAVFDISAPTDAEIIPEFTQHLVRLPKPYKCRILPRSNAKVGVVETRAASTVV
ncbi:cytochrome P450 [Obba rivulosa]|uniref:Cytochrome P450 n=1 Tax=Obba rivulosa TaxID=1052685 RepID=A0A8E2DNX8_9APHY|nr:cytochrome P450 [Obba rivulosa]